jgi:hypothetical protein
VARPLCPGCFSSSVVPVPHGAEPRSSDWLETVDGFGALWDAFDDWQCLVCGERWPHVESVVARNLGTGRPSNDLAPRSFVKHRHAAHRAHHSGDQSSGSKRPSR